MGRRDSHIKGGLIGIHGVGLDCFQIRFSGNVISPTVNEQSEAVLKSQSPSGSNFRLGGKHSVNRPRESLIRLRGYKANRIDSALTGRRGGYKRSLRDWGGIASNTQAPLINPYTFALGYQRRVRPGD